MEVCTSPLSAIPPGLVSFDYSMRGERFGYGFTRCFGDQDVDALDSKIRIHVLLLGGSTRGGEALYVLGLIKNPWNFSSLFTVNTGTLLCVKKCVKKGFKKSLLLNPRDRLTYL